MRFSHGLRASREMEKMGTEGAKKPSSLIEGWCEVRFYCQGNKGSEPSHPFSRRAVVMICSGAVGLISRIADLP